MPVHLLGGSFVRELVPGVRWAIARVGYRVGALVTGRMLGHTIA
jgi:hypothetical protein